MDSRRIPCSDLGMKKVSGNEIARMTSNICSINSSYTFIDYSMESSQYCKRGI
jgi:hypothetical protein